MISVVQWLGIPSTLIIQFFESLGIPREFIVPSLEFLVPSLECSVFGEPWSPCFVLSPAHIDEAVARDAATLTSRSGIQKELWDA